MEIDEFNEIMKQMAEQANAIIFHQQLISEIHNDLEKNKLYPHEQDYIYADKYEGSIPSEPKECIINDVKVIKSILHQAGKGLSDIKGADFLYEIEDEKYTLVQYKKAVKGSTFINVDRTQLDRFLDNCRDFLEPCVALF